MTLEEIATAPARLEQLERRVAELEATAKAAPEPERVTVTVETAAEKLDVTAADVRRWIKAGLLEAFRKGKDRKWLVTWASVVALPERLGSQTLQPRAALRPVSVDMEAEVRRLVEGGHKERRRG